MSDWQVVGRQRVLVNGDLLCLEILSDITLQEITTIFNSMLPIQAEYGYALMLIHLVGSHAFPPEARRFLSQFHRQHETRGATAVVGASPAMALFIDLVLRAVGLVSGYKPKARYFQTYAEAMTWLEEQRALGQRGLLRR